MANFSIKKGLDLKLVGTAPKRIDDAPRAETIALHPVRFRGVKPKLLVKEGDRVKGGAPLFLDKTNPSVMFVTPLPGTVSAIQYGERRSITAIVITPSSENDRVEHGPQNVKDMNRDQLVELLQKSGAFVYLRQRPFDKIPKADRQPKSIFINGMNTAPNAADQGFVLSKSSEELQLGIEALKKLTDGTVHLCYGDSGETGVFKKMEGVTQHCFSGPHPSGLVSTHIHFVDPIRKGDTVWYLDAVHCAAIGTLLKTGTFGSEKVICVSGGGAAKPGYFKSVIGASVQSLLAGGTAPGEQRVVNGTAIFGDIVTQDGHIGFYDSNLQVIPEGRKRNLLGWAMPGFKSFSASSRSFVSSILPSKAWNFNTNVNGGHRAIVWTDVYDQVMPLDIYTNFLSKAVLADDVEEAENLGILEVAEEDFALATYICPSKTDFGAIIGKGLETIEKEGY